MNIEPPEQWLCQLPSVDFDWVDDRNGHLCTAPSYEQFAPAVR